MTTKNENDKNREEFTNKEVQNTNQLYPDTLQVWRTQMNIQKDDDDGSSTTYHYGLVSDRSFTKGDLIMTGRAISISSSNNAHSIQIGYNQHAIIDMLAILINHSC